MDLQVGGTSADDPDLVRVEGPGVSGWARWPDAPDVGTTVNVELDVSDEVAWDDVEVGGSARPSGLASRTSLEVHGRVIDVDEQDVLTLRLPQGGILLVDTTGEAPLHVVGRAVTLHLDRVYVYPTNV
jgi:hypothetical protein